eukprot:9341412-Pyramimonas_sp.AAC.1
MLRSCPKRAHRYLFESAENHKLDGIRLSTGEVSTEPEDVIQAVVDHYTEGQQTRVPPETAYDFPWERDRAGAEPPLFPNVPQWLVRCCLARQCDCHHSIRVGSMLGWGNRKPAVFYGGQKSG